MTRQAFWFESQDWLSDLVKVVAARIYELGGHPYLVGGAVRARVRKEVTGVDEGIKDFDVASDLSAEVLMKAGVPGTTTVDLGKGPKYGVVAFAWKCPRSHRSEQVEVAMLRKDRQVGPKRTDVNVEFTDSIVEDLRRRDMPFNAMAYDLVSGEFFDPFDGKGSIISGVARATDDAWQCYMDDPLRMVRYFRFACRYDMEYDVTTLEAMSCPEIHDRMQMNPETDKLEVAGFNNLSGERVGDEFTKILSLKPAKAARAFRSMMEVGLLDKWLPEVVGMRFYPQDKKWHSHPVEEHTFMAMAAFNPFTIPEKYRKLFWKLGMWALLLHDVGKPVVHKATGKFYEHDKTSAQMADVIFDRLKLSRFFDKKRFLFYIESHMVGLTLGRPTKMLAKSGVAFFEDQEDRLAHLELMKAIRTADQQGRSFKLEQEEAETTAVYEKLKEMILTGKAATKKDLPVTGKDVLTIEKEVATAQGRPARKPHTWVGDVLDVVYEEEVNRQADARDVETSDVVRRTLLSRIRELVVQT
jgi:tRNA nucleotidyltransferase/poly(A) polymerase